MCRPSAHGTALLMHRCMLSNLPVAHLAAPLVSSLALWLLVLLARVVRLLQRPRLNPLPLRGQPAVWLAEQVQPNEEQHGSRAMQAGYQHGAPPQPSSCRAAVINHPPSRPPANVPVLQPTAPCRRQHAASKYA